MRSGFLGPVSRVVAATRAYLDQRRGEASRRGSKNRIETGAFAYCDGLDYVFVSRDLTRLAVAVEGRETLRHYLVEGREYELEVGEGGAVAVRLPAHVALVVERVGARASGGASPGATRAALTETGLTVRVPPSVVRGETVVVDSATGEFVERLRA